MIIGFEDAFTDIQSEYISLCLEYVNNDVDEVFAYIYQTRSMKMFNAFFKKDGKILSAGQLGTEEASDEFLEVGRDDISKIVDVCDKYEHKCPNELKLVYNVKTKKFDAELGYEDYSEKEKVTPFEVFLNWFRAEKAKCSKS
ncbi:hypothetical protein [Ruminococcus flavefaciens]|uniref:Uncharacterized protein n=1 Tax=Ruminococcus flavefaciens 007c TaxID=1341157 RepID=W7UAT0_RUMFL|nr:hypothetical protein [Ruminococcus flavefaciens]EWM52146.1 hypothetical protein RF007C_01870 [Ruminococcus flavefaciens 007c]